MLYKINILLSLKKELNMLLFIITLISVVLAGLIHFYALNILFLDLNVETYRRLLFRMLKLKRLCKMIFGFLKIRILYTKLLIIMGKIFKISCNLIRNFIKFKYF